MAILRSNIMNRAGIRLHKDATFGEVKGRGNDVLKGKKYNRIYYKTKIKLIRPC